MLLRAIFFSCFFALPFLIHAKTTTAITNNGDWTAVGTWDNGVPATGDIIIIPSGINVNLTSNVDLRGVGTTTISVSGSLTISNFAYIWLDSTLDALNVLTGGSVIPTGLGGHIRFGNGICCGLPAATVLINALPPPLGSDGTVAGPAIISNGTLPVTLISFNANVINDNVEIQWKTASEVNNDFFSIERSPDAETFEEIQIIKGKGTTNEENVYVIHDFNPIIGRSYYRLKQTDFNGTSTYSDLVTIEYEGPSFATLTVYPNPSRGDRLTLQLQGVKEEIDVPVGIVNMKGELVFEGILHVDHTGKATLEMEFNQPLSSGLYIVKAGPTIFLTQKVAVIR